MLRLDDLSLDFCRVGTVVEKWKRFPPIPPSHTHTHTHTPSCWVNFLFLSTDMSAISPPMYRWLQPPKPRRNRRKRMNEARNRNSPRNSLSMSRSRPKRSLRQLSPLCLLLWRAAEEITGNMICPQTQMIPVLDRVLHWTVSGDLNFFFLFFFCNTPHIKFS